MTLATVESGFNGEPAVFTAELKPHRSLGPIGFRVLMGLSVAVTLINVVFFLATNALPVAMFFGLDLALLYGAFWLNYRAARAREIVRLSRNQLDIHKVTPAGFVRKSQYNPFWARFDVARHAEFGITDMAVVERARRTTLGKFLGPEERDSFAKAFTAALADIKRRV
ncbi:DUF2244 domain-containing protein [Rhizobium sp. G21]|uniref:DUF2244 domain-containing protein n=1 Tax=Rhizobium sp. G21 TaxID=2758439 RepID=UPI0016043399|nr:DUF2244 domain-containing protein [Rhizobium sp. G21]MBB1248947.1 DUF2244 domain-containing protein [Rhizobium sp. G21]